VAKRNRSITGLFSNKSFTDLITGSQTRASSTSTNARVPRGNDLDKLAFGVKDSSTGTRFGSPSNPGSGYTSRGSTWSRLLQQSVTGGAASALGEAIGLGAFGGLGSLISGIFSLFGGSHTASKTLPPLVEFRLPNPVTQTVYVSSTGGSTYAGTSVETQLASHSAPPIYSSSQAATSHRPGVTSTTAQSAHIIQTVKNALLTSSSLNDIISEL